MVKQLTSEQRSQIVILLEQGMSPGEVAEKFDVNRSTVVRVRQKFLKHSTYDHLCGNGRPKKLTPEVLSEILIEINDNPRKSLRKLTKSLQNRLNITISVSSVKNALNSLNKYAFSPRKKPLLSKKNIKARFEFSKLILKTSFEDIKQIVFSDESKFELFGSKNDAFVWREPGLGLDEQYLTPTVKFGGGSLMVWGCFSYNGVGKLHFIDGIMDAAEYCSILSDNLFASVKKLKMNSFIFQQDNDPKHTSKLAKSFFVEKNVEVLPWPAQSPDMNPIENLWAIVKARVADLEPKNKDELKKAIKEAWESITFKTTNKLVVSFKKRAKLLYKAKGHHIDY
jgi:transposase